ncbi:MAG: DUF58 domain-containing protein [Oscillibacter sp.]|nr:DUF58 domain-containing protein [Oscillibacter sp.]
MTRQGTWLLLVALTWYLAGMFRTLSLTVLLLSELGLFLVMSALSAHFHTALDASFPDETTFGEKERDCACRLRLEVHGRLPAGRPRLTLGLSYRAQKRRSTQRFYGGAEPGRETDVTFYVRPPYAGPLYIELRQILTWDYLFLFPSKRRKREWMLLAVLPPPREARISPRSLPEMSGGQARESAPVPLDGMSPEVRDLREYRPGDSARSIHWKLSARTDRLWIRDYEDEQGERFTLYLNLSDGARMRPEQWDTFYEVLSAILLGLLRHRRAVRVFWRDGGEDLQSDVSDTQSRQAFFLQLYLSEPPDGTPEPRLTDFAFDTNLLWTRGTQPVWQFDSAAALREIAEQTFII